MTDTTLECRDAPLASDPAARLLRRAGASLLAFAAWRERRRLTAEFDRLGARMLADVGIERSRFGWHLAPGSIADGHFTIAKDGGLARQEREPC